MVEVGDLVVEEADQRAHQPALGLALFAEEEQVVPGEQGEVDLGNDGVFVADDAGEEFFAGLQHAEEVVADLLLDGLGHPAAGAEFSQGARAAGNGHGDGSPLNRIQMATALLYGSPRGRCHAPDRNGAVATAACGVHDDASLFRTV